MSSEWDLLADNFRRELTPSQTSSTSLAPLGKTTSGSSTIGPSEWDLLADNFRRELTPSQASTTSLEETSSQASVIFPQQKVRRAGPSNSWSFEDTRDATSGVAQPRHAATMGDLPRLKQTKIENFGKAKTAMPKLMTPINSLTPMELPAKSGGMRYAPPQRISSAATMDLPAMKTRTMGDLPDMGGSLEPVLEQEPARDVKEDYELLHLCGKGKKSVVRYAEHMLGGAQVVVKSCRKIQMDRRGWETLVEAVQIHKELVHPKIVRMKDLYVTNHAVHMVLECLEGGTLQEELERRGHFSEEHASYILRQLLEALDYLHEQDIVHRDITLRNIMLERGGELGVKLVDLDHAVESYSMEKLSVPCGSVAYAAPELLRGEYTEKADMWSVGVVAHMLLTGEPVYSGSTQEVRQKAQEGCPALSEKLQKCSAGAQEFVRSLLVDKAALRMSAEEALSHPWL